MSDINGQDPFVNFKRWMAKAEKTEPNDANAMTLATVGADGRPSARMVLLKGLDERGFVFYTNLESRKGRQLAENPRACLVFHWKSLRRQVNVEGAVMPVSPEEADAYFGSRDRGSQIGAWASQQSRPLAGRFELEKRVAQFAAKFHVGKVPRPAHWSGFRVAPERIEFWEDGTFRLHDRTVFHRQDDGGWRVERLFP